MSAADPESVAHRPPRRHGRHHSHSARCHRSAQRLSQRATWMDRRRALGGTALHAERSESGPRSPARPLVDFVHAVDTKAWRKSLLSRNTQRQISSALGEVRDLKYEIAVDFQGALKSAVIARCSGAGTILGSAHPRETPARVFYTRRVATAKVHVVEQYFSLAEAVAGKSTSRCPTSNSRTTTQAEADIANKLRAGEQNHSPSSLPAPDGAPSSGRPNATARSRKRLPMTA